MVRRKAQEVEAVPARERMAELEDEKELTTMQAARGFLEQFIGVQDVSVVVLKRSRETGKWEYIKSFPPDVVDEDYIRSRFRGGSYKLIVRGPKGAEHPNGYYGSHTEEIADLNEDGTLGRIAAPAAVAAPASVGSPMEMATEFTKMIMGAVTAALTAMRPPVERDPIEILRTAKELFQPASLVGPDQIIEKWGEGIDLGLEKGLELGRDSRRDDSFASVAKEFAPVIRDVVGAVAQQGRRPGPPPQLPPGPPGARALPQPQPQPGAPVPTDVKTLPAWLGLLWPHMNVIAGLAMGGFDPDLAAAQLLSKLPDEAYEALALDMEADGWVNRTTVLLPNPLVAQYGGWVTAVLKAMEAQVAESGKEDEEPKPPEPALDQEVEP